ncbi:condensation domain-containing protein, partial [Lysinibacillus fusiformis]|uniref:condensation domain-containing protein n=1 Tax=Lysinibacillus fusiformis TaxID=28031 RepID=UPI00380D19A3
MYQLTYPQKEMYYLQKQFLHIPFANIAGSMLCSEVMDFAILEKAINKMFKENQAFQLRLKEIDGEVFQYTVPYVNQKIVRFDFLGRQQDYDQWCHKMCTDVFELIEQPLYRTYLVRDPEGKTGFLFIMHHIISDAWTMTLVGSSILQNYSNLEKKIKDESVQTFDYTNLLAREKEYAAHGRFLKAEKFWIENIKKFPDESIFPRKEYAENILVGARKEVVFSEEKIRKIYDYCNLYKISIFSFLMANVSLLCMHYFGKEKMVFGTPLANRVNAREKNTFGFFISTLPVYIDQKSEQTFFEYLQALNKNWFNLLKYQAYPFEKILTQYRNLHHVTHSPLEIVFSYQNAKFDKKMTEYDYKSEWYFNDHAIFPLTIHVDDREENGQLSIFYEYQTTCFSSEEIEQFHQYFDHLVDTLLNSDIHILLKDLEFIPKMQKEKIVNEWNNTAIAYSGIDRVDKLFQDQVKRNVNKPAVVSGSTYLTYQQLEEKSNLVCQALLSHAIKPGSSIGVVCERNKETVILFLGILKAGCTYVPLDLKYPVERLHHMMKDAEIQVVLGPEKTCPDWLVDKLYLSFSEIENNHITDGEAIDFVKPAE